jgi:hypothetical protein
MLHRFCLEFETSLRKGIHGYALPTVTLIVGLELEVMARVITWVSNLAFWSEIKILPFLL